MSALDAVFARIRERRDQLDRIDDELSAVIQQVESALRSLRPGMPIEMDYETPDGTRWLIFQKHNADWQIMWSNTEVEDKHTPLVSASRRERARVFEVGPDGMMPIEALIHEVPHAIDEIIEERSALIQRARALSSALIGAGIPATK